MPNQWIETPFADSFMAVEKAFTDRALRQISGPNVLLLGREFSAELLYELDFPHLVTVAENSNQVAASVACDCAYLPFASGSFASVIVPHVLERHTLPHQVLREVYRVMQSEGHLLLTCFNPWSLAGLQKSLRNRRVLKGQYYSLRRVKDWLQLLGFEVVGSAMYHYAPLTRNTRRFNFINAIGDRWLPMLGSSFVITARKREAGMRLIGNASFARRKAKPRLAGAPARNTMPRVRK